MTTVRIELTKQEMRKPRRIQCGYHWGSSVECRLVQLTHNRRDPSAWQEPKWVCQSCREYLTRNHFRYYPPKS